MIVEVMSVAREGGCACGAVRYRLTSDPLFTHCCHCLNCQRQTESAFVINLLIEADRLCAHSSSVKSKGDMPCAWDDDAASRKHVRWVPGVAR